MGGLFSWPSSCNSSQAVVHGDTHQRAILFEEVGGDPLVNAAAYSFYKRLFSDKRISKFFNNAVILEHHVKQINILAFAFGKQENAAECSFAMDRTHRKLIQNFGINDEHFDIVCLHFEITLRELKVKPEIMHRMMVQVYGMRDQVLCRGKWVDPSAVIEQQLTQI